MKQKLRSHTKYSFFCNQSVFENDKNPSKLYERIYGIFQIHLYRLIFL